MPNKTMKPSAKTRSHEHNKALSRIKRYASVTSAMSAPLAQTAKNKLLGRETDHGLQALMLTKAMGKLKGPVMKIAQMLSTIPDAIPPDYALEFQSLQADAPSMGPLFVKRRLVSELGPQWKSLFHTFDLKATSAASLGQVHKATITDKNALIEVACKLQYPDMSSTVQADLNQLKLALKIYETTLGGVKTEHVFTEISERLHEELDYAREAQTLAEYSSLYKTAPVKTFQHIHLPRVIPALSTDRLLTMTWLEGKKVRDILDAPQDYRNRMGALTFQAWYYPLFAKGLIHGDPHLGNYSFTGFNDGQDEGVNIFDFGCIRRFSRHFLQGIQDLYHALHRQDQALEVHAFETLGFTDVTKDIISILHQWALLLYEPVLDDRVRPLQKDHSGLYGKETAEKVHAELRKVGGVTPPREFVFMDRAAVGIGSLCLHLRAEQNWCQLYQEVLALSSLTSQTE